MDFANKKILIAYFSKKGENWYTHGLAKLPMSAIPRRWPSSYSEGGGRRSFRDRCKESGLSRWLLRLLRCAEERA
jgi:hypothetical protein